MIRPTITRDEDLAAELDRHIARAIVANRSEVTRDLVRRGLSALPVPVAPADCLGVISCAVDQSVSELSRRIRMSRMGRHDAIMFTASVPVSHSRTIDIVIVHGPVARVGGHARAVPGTRRAAWRPVPDPRRGGDRVPRPSQQGAALPQRHPDPRQPLTSPCRSGAANPGAKACRSRRHDVRADPSYSRRADEGPCRHPCLTMALCTTVRAQMAPPLIRAVGGKPDGGFDPVMGWGRYRTRCAGRRADASCRPEHRGRSGHRRVAVTGLVDLDCHDPHGCHVLGRGSPDGGRCGVHRQHRARCRGGWLT